MDDQMVSMKKDKSKFKDKSKYTQSYSENLNQYTVTQQKTIKSLGSNIDMCKALNRIHELEQLNDGLEKEKTVYLLEHQKSLEDQKALTHDKKSFDSRV